MLTLRSNLETLVRQMYEEPRKQYHAAKIETNTNSIEHGELNHE